MIGRGTPSPVGKITNFSFVPGDAIGRVSKNFKGTLMLRLPVSVSVSVRATG